MNNGDSIIISTESEMMPGNNNTMCNVDTTHIDITGMTMMMQKDEELATLVESKLTALSPAPLSPAITAACTDDSMMSDDEDEGLNITPVDSHNSTPDAKIPPSSSSSSSSSEEVLEDWNLVVVPASEGEASVLAVTITDGAALIVTDAATPTTEATSLPNTPEHDASESSPDGSACVEVSMSDLQELRRMEQVEAVNESAKEVIEPMKMLRKGAIAALGGTMVGVGLIMIPLPTPFGAVVASSGMAVLGSEFESAREMNEKMIDTAKAHWEATREKMIQGIEEMEGKRPTTIQGTTGGTEEQEEVEGAVDETEQVPRVSSTNSKPLPIMNPAEQKRQEELAKQRASKAQQPDFFEQLKRSTGTYLSRHLMPILKRSKEGSDAGSLPDADITVQSETETLSEMDQTEELGDNPTKCGDEDEAPTAATRMLENSKPKIAAVLSKSISSLTDDGAESTTTPETLAAVVTL